MIADTALRAAGVTVAAERTIAGPVDLAGLDHAERGRAGGMAPDRRAGFVAGRRLARILLAELAIGPGLDALCARCGRPHAAPRALDGPALVGIAHAAGLTVAAAVPTGRCAALGVDIELDDTATRRRIAELAPGMLSGAGDVAAAGVAGDPDVADVAAVGVAGWTRVEAVLKADGRGLRVDPADLRWTPRGGELWASVPGRKRPLRVVTLPGPAGAVVSVAIDPRDAS